ncbi:DUF5712 family protein [Aestuariivivens insulae]|uniref:DUF5712 family protein n=1 Tax=Aestuariivivens insulae TaxID=1621988 RepID=UPI00374CAADC
MYIAISKQHQGENFKCSVSDFVNYQEKERETMHFYLQEHFFAQSNDRISAKDAIKK